MKYMTKEWYKNIVKNHFPFKLEITNYDKNYLSIEDIFSKEYNNRFNEMKKNLPKGYEEEVFNEIFNSYVINTKKFFDTEVLERVSDIRLLALGKAFKEEYNFINEEILKKDAMQAYDNYYNTIKSEIPENISRNLYLHDCLINNIMKTKDKVIIEIDCSQEYGNVKSITFENYKIMKEEMNFNGGYWLYEEIYIVNNQYELHVLIDVPSKKNANLGYFTIRAQNIIFN